MIRISQCLNSFDRRREKKKDLIRVLNEHEMIKKGAIYLDIKENSHTLLIFDVVELDKGISEELQKEIERDGVVIYEKA